MNTADNSPRYAPGQLLGKGGMGEVLEARDGHLDRAVAMKIIRDDRPSRETRLRFIQEARVLAQLEHPNIVPVYDLDTDAQGHVFCTMKKVQGATLKTVLDRLKTGEAEAVAKYPLTQLLTIFQKVCDAAAYAHSRGIIHRDLKPENIMLGEFGEVLVLDWGLAKILTPDDAATPPVTESGADGELSPSLPEGIRETSAMPDDTALTLDGEVMGTPVFMAPEQAEGRVRDMDGRTDIFALGGILYSLLSLRPPTGGSTVREVLENVKSGYIPPPILYNQARTRSANGADLETPIGLLHCPGGEIPAALSAVAMKALALDAAHRYQTVPELQAEIAKFQGGFATVAEGASRSRRFMLWVRRNKAVSVSVVVVLVFITSVMGRIISSERAARTALADLRGLLPTLEKHIQSLIREHEFEAALNRLNSMLVLSPASADYLNLKGNMLQSLLRFEEAVSAYRQTLGQRRDQPQAEENLKVCEKLAQEVGRGKTPEPRHFLALEALMNQQNRQAESVAMLRNVGKDRTAILEDYRAALRKAGWEKPANFLTMDDSGLLVLDANHARISDLAPLRGMPLGELHIGGNPITDLSPLKDMALRKLVLHGAPVSDLSPLRTTRQLTTLWMQSVPVSDLSPLAGLRLKDLSMGGTRVSDLGPLKGMPLESLDVGGTSISSINALVGMPLKRLWLHNAKVSDLSALRGMPLEELNLDYTPVSDLTPLKGVPLKRLHLGYTRSVISCH